MKIRVFTYKDVDKIAHLPREAQLNALRQAREDLKHAWDIHKSDVAYGLYVYAQGERDIYVQWRNDMLDLKIEAFYEQNIPADVRRHLK